MIFLGLPEIERCDGADSDHCPQDRGGGHEDEGGEGEELKCFWFHDNVPVEVEAFCYQLNTYFSLMHSQFTFYDKYLPSVLANIRGSRCVGGNTCLCQLLLT